MKARVCHASANQPTTDGEEIFKKTLSVGEQFTTRIVKVEAGDLIRIGAVRDNAWASNFLPYVQPLSVTDYAKQYLSEVDGIVNTDNCSESLKAEYAGAKTALQSAIQTETGIQDKLSALEAVVEKIKTYVAPTSISLSN